MPWPDLSPTPPVSHLFLDVALVERLHDAGVVNEDALVQVLRELAAGQPLTRDHLVMIFGVAVIYALMTTHDETARQLVREAYDLLGNPETNLDLRDWLKAVRRMVPEVDQVTEVHD